MLTFHPADRFASGDLSALFTRAYAEYFVPVNVDATTFELMVAAYDIDLSASRIAVRDDQPVALALLGVREARGWIGAMGVAPERRGEQIGLAVMEAVIASARRLSLRSIDLEIITQNLPALRIYRTLGFRRRRTLDIWSRDSDATFPLPPLQSVRTVDVAACLAAFDDLHTVAPPWQRDLPSLQHMAASLRGLGIVEGKHVTACVLYRMDRARATVLDAAALPGQRTAAIESVLRALIRDRAGSPIRLVNLPQDDPASTAMQRVGAGVELQQYEMTVEL